MVTCSWQTVMVVSCRDMRTELGPSPFHSQFQSKQPDKSFCELLLNRSCFSSSFQAIISECTQSCLVSKVGWMARNLIQWMGTTRSGNWACISFSLCGLTWASLPREGLGLSHKAPHWPAGDRPGGPSPYVPKKGKELVMSASYPVCITFPLACQKQCQCFR